MEEAPRPVQLRSGHTAWVRPVRGTDAVELQQAFALLSDLSRYRRFLSGKLHLTGGQAAYLADVDHRDHEAFVALPEKRGTDIVGVARFIRHADTPTDAELAITVVDEWHGRGLATTLLRLLSARARAVGVRRLVVDMLADNDAVLRLMRGAGLISEVANGQLISGHIELVPAAPPSEQVAL